MSPFEKLLEIVEAGFPRVSGDEPRAAAAGLFMTAFSPRERG